MPESSLCDVASFTAANITSIDGMRVNADDGFVGSGERILPFQMLFYGTLYPTMRICSNGWLGFDAGIPVHAVSGLPSANLNATVAPLLEDLMLDGASRIYCGTASSPSGAYVVTWEALRHSFNGTAGSGTSNFQAVLERDGRITFNYQHVGTTGPAVSGVNSTNGLRGYQLQDAMQPVSGSSFTTYTPDPGTVPALILDQTLSLTGTPAMRFSGETDLTSSISFTLNSTALPVSFTMSTAGRSFQIPTTSLVEGLNQIVAVAIRNGLTESVMRSVRLDTIGPTAAFTRPAAFSWFKAPFKAIASASDANSGMDVVKLFVNGLEYGSKSPDAYGRYITTVSLTSGRKVLTIQAKDVAGNASTISRTVYVDRYPPYLKNMSAPYAVRRGTKAAVSVYIKECFSMNVRLYLTVSRGRPSIGALTAAVSTKRLCRSRKRRDSTGMARTQEASPYRRAGIFCVSRPGTRPAMCNTDRYRDT